MEPKSSSLLSSSMIIFLFLSQLLAITAKNLTWNNNSLLDIQIPGGNKLLRRDSKAIQLASKDYGKIVHIKPSAVLYPSSVEDIVNLVRVSYNSTPSFGVAAKGRGHSIRGQAMVSNGVVVEMTSLNIGSRIRILKNPKLGDYVDVGAEQLWIDVLNATYRHGLSPVSWTDYLYLTVGGTLSNAGVSGQSFRYGPQISNVYELDVITGKGQFVTCSKTMNSDLFYAVLGGLGQFGIITRARIRLDKAPTKVKWINLIYTDFSAYSRDQEKLISMNDAGLVYLKGAIIMNYSHPLSWKSSFSPDEVSKVKSLLTQHSILYCTEAITTTINEDELERFLKGLRFLPGYALKKDASYMYFLDRVRREELLFQSLGLWDVPHPWLNLFVPRSRIMDFHQGVMIDIIQKRNSSTGPLFFFASSRKKWDNRMSAVTPDEDIFYFVSVLHSAVDGNWQARDKLNKEILDFCKRSGIKYKEYLQNPKTKEGWMNHFGSKWETFAKMKTKFDPKMILSPGQKIFN